MKLLEGKKIAEKILSALERKIKKTQRKPGLAVILVGDNPASELYVKLKRKAARRVGIRFQLFRFPWEAQEEEIIRKIKKLNASQSVSGLIVQLPLPEKFSAENIINAVRPEKDVDGFHPENLRLFLENRKRFFPVFPQAILRLLEASRWNLENEKALVVANSQKFGEIMTAALKSRGMRADYFLPEKLKANLTALKKARVVVSAVGRPGFLKGEMFRKGVIVIDGGITRKGQKVLGDVEFDSLASKAAFLSPVPGGVGPLTIACLLQNVFLAAKKNSR